MVDKWCMTWFIPWPAGGVEHKRHAGNGLVTEETVSWDTGGGDPWYQFLSAYFFTTFAAFVSSGEIVWAGIA